MAQFTTTLGDRNPDKLKLTPEEAEAMAAEGFRFAEFSPERGTFRLSLPFRIAQNLDTGRLTIMQG